MTQRVSDKRGYVRLKEMLGKPKRKLRPSIQPLECGRRLSMAWLGQNLVLAVKPVVGGQAEIAKRLVGADLMLDIGPGPSGFWATFLYLDSLW